MKFPKGRKKSHPKVNQGSLIPRTHIINLVAWELRRQYNFTNSLSNEKSNEITQGVILGPLLFVSCKAYKKAHKQNDELYSLL